MIPQLRNIFNSSPVAGKPEFSNLGSLISTSYLLVFYLAISFALVWLSWGVFEYIFAGGDKDQLSSAKSRITWALVGLIFIAIAYLIAQWATQILQPKPGTVTF